MIRPGKKFSFTNKIGSLVLGGLLLMLLVMSLAGIKVYATTHVPPGISIASEDLGWSSLDDASEKINPKIEVFLASPIILSWNQSEFNFDPSQFNIQFDFDKTFKQVQAKAMGQGIFDLWSTPEMVFVKNNQPLEFSWDQSKIDAFIKGIAAKTEQLSFDATLVLENGVLKAKAGQAGRELKKDQLTKSLREKIATLESAKMNLPIVLLEPKVSEERTTEARQKIEELLQKPLALTWDGGQKAVTREEIFSWLSFFPRRLAEDFKYESSLTEKYELGWEVDENKLGAFLETIRPTVERIKQDAKLGIVEGTVAVVQPEVAGLRINSANSYQNISALLGKAEQIQLGMDLEEPKISAKTLPSLGLKELIGRGESEFQGSTWGRATNIAVGSARFSGLILAPGETFSFVEHMGEVIPEEGYVKELVIFGKKLVPQYGGGLCQVSTTFFRAAVFAGLAVPQHVSHAFRVSWYDWPLGPGMDATVYNPEPDLKVINDMPTYIFMNVYITGDNHLVWELWGTKDREVTVTGPFTVWTAADGAMGTNFYRTVKYNDGREVTEDFPSDYESPAKYSR